jgi:glycosyltransferase involved in cell wall biosynthesis
MNSIGILWAQYGPYHFARVKALKKQAGAVKVHALELANRTRDYEWRRSATGIEVITLCPGAVAEQLSFMEVFRRARQTFAEINLGVCMLPSYAPKQSLAALLAAKSLGIRTVMMNESHAGTARARGAAAWAKRRLAGLFDAALVGGLPQKRYFVTLGLPKEKIFTGYDAVDNDFFARKAGEIRSREQETRRKYCLPERYFLSLGRFVPKKNLTTLICAYRKVLDSARDCRTHLVLVGSGGDELKLRSLCRDLRLPTHDKMSIGKESGKLKIESEPPGVHFYGFRQIEENPMFYALADAFVLPSLWEEWGLVVNEAMASGLPVVVSETAGCVEDLLKPGWPVLSAMPGTDLSVPWAPITGRIRQNGFVFNPESCESLAAALLALVSSPLLREAMGKASRAIIENFSCEAFARNAWLAVRTANGESVIPPCAALPAEESLGAASGMAS